MRINKRIQILNQQLTDKRAVILGRWAVLDFLIIYTCTLFLPYLKLTLAYMNTNMNLLDKKILKPENSAGLQRLRDCLRYGKSMAVLCFFLSEM